MFVEKFDLTGKVAVVTGAGRGLGRQMALHLARAGADIVAAARTREQLEGTAADVQQLGRRSLVVPTDVTQPDQVEALIRQAIAEMGHVDILVNNAGGGTAAKPIWDIAIDEWRYYMDLNISSAFYASRAIAPHMVERRSGKVINVASGWGFRGNRNSYMYCCAKGAVVQLTRTLAMSLAQDNVQVNCIAPGLIPHLERMDDERRQNIMAREHFQTIGRFGQPREVGPLCVFLASSASNYMTGETVLIDGGALDAAYAPTGYAPVVG